MNYEEFKSVILQRMQYLLAPEADVQLQTIHKNNGQKLDGLVISNRTSNISPTVFLNHYYDKQTVFADLDAICRDILLTYEQNRSDEKISADFFTDYTLISKSIAYRIINYGKNKELLEAVPYVRYLDLAIVFYCLLNFSESGNATVLIHNTHLKLWNITAAQLYEQACKTTPDLLPYDFRNMASVISDLFSGPMPADQATTKPAPFCPMYVLTNAQKLYGASCILYPGLLEAIAEKLDSDLFILPSSIHEIILLPAVSRSYQNELASMVSEINQTELAAEEVLSSCVYYYSRAEQALSICL